MHVHAVCSLVWQVPADLNTPVARSITCQAPRLGGSAACIDLCAPPAAHTPKAGPAQAATARTAQPTPPSDRDARGLLCVAR